MSMLNLPANCYELTIETGSTGDIPDKVPVIVDTADEMSRLVEERTHAFYNCELWTRSNLDYSAEVAADFAQAYFIALNSQPDGSDGAYVKCHNTNEWRLDQFGSELDESPWERAANLMQEGDTLIVPQGVTYLFTRGVTFYQNQITIKSNGSSLTVPRIKADSDSASLAITLLSIKGNNCTIKNINFVGSDYDTAHQGTVYSDTIGIDLSRTGIDDTNESYANLDDWVQQCYFGDLGVGIQGAGRNVNVKFNIFYACRIGIAPLIFEYDPGTGTEKSSTRGWQIYYNWFQATSLPYMLKNDTSTISCCIYTPIDESISPIVRDIVSASYQIKHNFFDFCGPQYIGTLSKTAITDNYANNVTGAFVTCLPESGYINSGGYGNFGIIANNQWLGVADEEAEGGIKNAVNFAKITRIIGLRMAGNTASMCTNELVDLDLVAATFITGETYYGANFGQEFAGDSPAITIGAVDTSDSDSYSYILSCTITPHPRKPYLRGVTVARNAAYIKVMGNHIGEGSDTSDPYVSTNDVLQFNYSSTGLELDNIAINLRDSYFRSRLNAKDFGNARGFGGGIIISDVKAGEALVIGKGVYLDDTFVNSDKAVWKKWNPSSATTCGLIGLVLSDVDLGEYPNVIIYGPAWMGAGYGIEAGKTCYMDEVTPGEISYSIPNLAGGAVQEIGWGLPGRDGIFICPGPVRPTAAALDAKLTTIYSTSPGTPSYSLNNLREGGFGFHTADDGYTVLKVIANLQDRQLQIEYLLRSAGLLANP